MRQEAGASSMMTSYKGYDVTQQSANQIPEKIRQEESPSQLTWWGGAVGGAGAGLRPRVFESLFCIRLIVFF